MSDIIQTLQYSSQKVLEPGESIHAKVKSRNRQNTRAYTRGGERPVSEPRNHGGWSCPADAGCRADPRGFLPPFRLQGSARRRSLQAVQSLTSGLESQI